MKAQAPYLHLEILGILSKRESNEPSHRSACFPSAGEKPFSCLHCHRAFADRSNLRAHLQTHSEMKRYQCACCLKTFSRISLLAKHQEAGCLLSWQPALRQFHWIKEDIFGIYQIGCFCRYTHSSTSPSVTMVLHFLLPKAYCQK